MLNNMMRPVSRPFPRILIFLIRLKVCPVLLSENVILFNSDSLDQALWTFEKTLKKLKTFPGSKSREKIKNIKKNGARSLFNFLVRLDLATDLTLQIGKVVFDGNSIDENALTSFAASASSTGQTSLSYASTTTATLGDYMELKLVDGSTSQVLTNTFS